MMRSRSIHSRINWIWMRFSRKIRSTLMATITTIITITNKKELIVRRNKNMADSNNSNKVIIIILTAMMKFELIMEIIILITSTIKVFSMWIWVSLWIRNQRNAEETTTSLCKRKYIRFKSMRASSPMMEKLKTTNE